MIRLRAAFPGLARRLTPAVLALAVAACGSDNPQSNGGQEEPATAGCHDGTLDATGALYQVCYPSSWNGDLVVYAHGYVGADQPIKKVA